MTGAVISYDPVFKTGSSAGRSRPMALDWRSNLIQSDKSGPKPLLANVLHALRESGEWTEVLAYDEFAMVTVLAATPPWHKEEFKPRVWSDADTIPTTEWMQREGIGIGTRDVEAAVEAVAREAPRHPICEHLGGLIWDGQPRVPVSHRKGRALDHRAEEHR